MRASLAGRPSLIAGLPSLVAGRPSLVAGLALLGLTGCTFTPGSGFLSLTGIELSVGFTPEPARDLGDGLFLTDEGERLRLADASLTVERFEFEELAGGVSFDPANPPPGYTFCHGGHCHRDDGALVDYPDIEAELAGDAASFSAVVSASLDASLDLLAGPTSSLLDAPLDLPSGRISRARLALGDRELEVERFDEEGALIGTYQIALPAGVLTEGYALAIDRDLPPSLGCTVDLGFGATLLDGVDFSTLDPLVPLIDADDPAGAMILSNLGITPMHIECLESA